MQDRKWWSGIITDYNGISGEHWCALPTLSSFSSQCRLGPSCVACENNKYSFSKTLPIRTLAGTIRGAQSAKIRPCQG